MKDSKKQGSSLTQYAIIIALVALAIVPVFYFLGSNIVSSFTALDQGLSGQKESLTNNNNTLSSVTEISTESSTVNASGSPANPTKNCQDGLCTVDYGEYNFTGIPENLNDYLKTTGTSGTTETLLKLLDQIIAKSDSIQTTADKSLLKDISNQGHDIANNQKEVEIRAKEMLLDPTEKISSGFFTDLEMLMLGSNVNLLNDKMKKLTDELKDSTNQNDKNILAIVGFLVDDIQNINKNLYNIGQNVSNGVNPVETYQEILNPESSTLTDLDSAIICNTGDGSDKGNECQ